jgi:Fe2+ transport system protein FeoA
LSLPYRKVLDKTNFYWYAKNYKREHIMHIHHQPLTMLRPGDKGVITALKLEPSSRNRLIDRGLMLGSQIEIMCHNDVGGLLMLAIGDTRLAIERETAQHIWVTPLQQDQEGQRVPKWLQFFCPRTYRWKKNGKRHCHRHGWWK